MYRCMNLENMQDLSCSGSIDETCLLDRQPKLARIRSNGIVSAHNYFLLVANKELFILTRNRKKILPSHFFLNIIFVVVCMRNVPHNV